MRPTSAEVKVWYGHAVSPEGVDILHRMGVVCLHPLTFMKNRYQNRIELLQGTLDLLILQTLLWAPQHGYGISQAIRSNSGQLLNVDTGSLYPALHRLEAQKWISSQWKVSENNQRVKVYQLTVAGRKHLALQRTRWEQMSEAIWGVLNATGREGQA
jgi:PadR family transcriptional regulator, regulatory protein PadR